MLPALARHGVNIRKMTLAAFSTKTEAAITAALNKAKWKDVKDEVKSVGALMREGTTNHSVELPSTFLKQDVTDKLRRLHVLVENKQRHEAFVQVRALKAMVKDELYNHRPQQQMMAFSTVPEHHAGDDENRLHELKWGDVKEEVNEIHSLMVESSTNHSDNVPDVELEQFIEKAIDEIKVMLEKNPTQRGLVFRKIHALKGFVKQRMQNDLSTKDHIKAFEQEMKALRWSDIKNEMEQIHQLMREHTTNRSVAKPSTELEKTVDDGLRDIDAMIQAHPSPKIQELVFDRIHKLKGIIKAEIYN